MEYWGELAVILNVAIFFGSISSIKIENAIFRVKNNRVIARVLATGIRVSMLVHLLIIPVFVFVFGNLSLLIVSLSTSLLNILQVNNLKNEKVVLNYTLNGLYTFVPYLQILIFAPKPEFVGLTYLISLLCNLYFLRPHLLGMVSIAKFQRTLKLTSLQLRYTFPQTLVNLFRIRMIYLFLPVYFSNTEIGIFNLIERIAGVVSSTLALIIRPLYIKNLNSGKIHVSNLNRLLILAGVLFLASVLTIDTVPHITEVARLFDENLLKMHLLMLVTLAYAQAYLNWADKLYEYMSKQKLLFTLECATVPMFIVAALFLTAELSTLIGVIAIFYLSYNVVTLRLMQNYRILFFHLLTLVFAWIITNIF